MKIILLILSAICTVYSQGDVDCFGEGDFSPDVKTEQVMTGAENFGIDLFKTFSNKYSTISFIMSPYSIWSVLKLTYYGTAGVTEQELQAALGVPSKRDAFWGSHLIELRRKINQDTTLSSYDQVYFANDVNVRQCALGKVVGISTLDFKQPTQAANRINKDIEDATRGEIQRFVNGNYIRNARFVLINALYFKGKWETQFDKAKTINAPFFSETGAQLDSQARMMETVSKFNYIESPSLGASAVELPYQNTSFVMMIILPDEGSSVSSVLSKLNADTLRGLKAGMKNDAIVKVNLPAFNFSTKIDRILREVLQDMGIVSLFQNGRADLSQFVPDEALFVSNALHQAIIRVDEEGTVAAAVTGLITTRQGTKLNRQFKADRPFIFLIRDNFVDVTFFIGVYRDPKHSVVT